MLTKNQEIIYRRSEEEISRLTVENTKKIDMTTLAYIRYSQPFTKKGQQLTIPKGKKYTITSRIRENPKRKGNVLVVQTLNSVYKIEYVNIDLEKILADGQGQGVNKSIPEGGLPPFPELKK